MTHYLNSKPDSLILETTALNYAAETYFNLRGKKAGQMEKESFKTRFQSIAPRQFAAWGGLPRSVQERCIFSGGTLQPKLHHTHA